MKRLLAALPLAFCACNNESPKPDPSALASASAAGQALSAQAAASLAGAGATAPSPFVPKAPEGPPACKVSEKKVWASGVNKLTGLSVSELPDKRVAIGLAQGLSPYVLVVDIGGEGKLLKVSVKSTSDLGKTIDSKDGTRTIMRVTPVRVDGEKASAFVDYRDEYKNKKRRVACGPAESNDAWIHFDDIPYLDRDPKPAGKDRDALFKAHEHEQGEEEHDDADMGYHELRDCRSFVDTKTGETWIVGSVLRGVAKDDKTIEWSSSLVVDTGPKKHELHLHEVVLKGDPPNLKVFEVPISRAVGEGAYLLATRFGGSLRAAVLNKDKTLRGKLMTYSGFPTIPHASADGGDTVLVTSVTKDKGLFALRGLRVPAEKPALPKALAAIDTHAADKGHSHEHGHDEEHDHVDHSETDPDFVRDAKGRRWLAYIEGERGKGKLSVVPVDESFHAVGKAFLLTNSSELASEARLVPLSDGTMLAVSLREGEKGLDLVTEELQCEVMME